MSGALLQPKFFAVQNFCCPEERSRFSGQISRFEIPKKFVTHTHTLFLYHTTFLTFLLRSASLKKSSRSISSFLDSTKDFSKNFGQFPRYGTSVTSFISSSFAQSAKDYKTRVFLDLQ